MNRFVQFFAIIFLVGLMSQGCSIEKRRYLKGFHVTSNFFIGKELQNDFDPNANEGKEKRHVPPDNSEVATLQSEQAVLVPNLDTIVKESQRQEEKTVQIQQENSTKSIQKRRVSLEKLRLAKMLEPVFNPIKEETKKSENLEEEEEEKQWFPLLLGIFLGTLLALVALPIFFIVICIILNFAPDDVFQFNVRINDPPFKKGFKRAYNSVMKVGMAILFFLMVSIILVAFLLEFYALYGVLGVILVIIIFALFILLVWTLMKRFLGFIFPNN